MRAFGAKGAEVSRVEPVEELLSIASLVMVAVSIAVEPQKNISPPRPAWKRFVAMRPLILGVLLIASFAGLSAALQSWMLSRALRDSTRALVRMTELLPQPAPTSGDWFPLFPFSPLAEARSGLDEGTEPTDASLDELADSANPRAPVKKTTPTRRKSDSLPLPQSVVASQETVLRWAEQRLVPQGRSVPASSGMPAGIELSGVAGLGIGLRDGDRLVRVGGVAAVDRSGVVAEVLSARGRRDEAIVAVLVRMTPRGPVTFSVTVEQPYR